MQFRACACGAASEHSTELSRQRRTRSPSTGSHSFPGAEHGRQLQGLNRRLCGLAAATIAFKRVGAIVLATSWDVLHDGFALRRSPMRPSNSSHARPPVGPAAVDHSAKLSLLGRARFWSAIQSAKLGEHMGDSRAGANRRPCGLAPATPGLDHAAKPQWAQGAAF